MQQPHISLYAVVLAIGAVQGFFLMMSLLTVGHHRKHANSVLAILMLLFAYDLFDEFLLESHYMQFVPRIIAIEHITDLLYGPVIYLYVLRISGRFQYKAKRYWRHFLPGGLAGFVAMYFLLFYPTDAFLQFLEDDDSTPLALLLYEFLTTITGVASILVYLVLSLRVLFSHQKTIVDNYSFREAVDLQWLKTVLYALGSLSLVYLGLFLWDVFDVDTPELLDSLLYLSMISCIFFLGFKGVRQPLVFSEPEDSEEVVIQTPNVEPASEYQGSGIDETESKLILESLQQLLDDNPLYLEPKLTLADLAKISGFKSHYLSQAINQNLQVNFFDFINRYRVEFACEQLQQSAPNVLAVAMESGFNSKSSFYNAFKKYTGMTPKQYQYRGRSPPNT